MGEADDARRSIADARERMTWAAEELSHRTSPTYVKGVAVRKTMEWKDELPRDFPGDVPQYPGSKVSLAQGTADQGVAVTFDSPDDLATVAKFYEDSLAAMGWQTKTQNIPEGEMILADKEDRILQAMLTAGGQGTLVEMIIAPAQ